MSMLSQDMQPQRPFVHLRGKNNEGMDNFLQYIADGFLVLIDENKQRGKQIEALSQEIARLHRSGLQTRLPSSLPRAETSCQSASGNDETVCRMLEKIQAEIAELRAEIRRPPEVKIQAGNERDSFQDDCSQRPAQNSYQQDTRPAWKFPRTKTKQSQVSGEQPDADSVYNSANVLYRINDFWFNPDRKRLFFSGNLEHVPLLPILAVIFFQQYLLPAFQRVSMSLG